MTEKNPCSIAVIPARGGSKGIPGKNLKPLGGKPLLQWTAEAALACSSLDRVILSTDSEEIAQAGQEMGLEVPFLRPRELGEDNTPIVPVLQDLLGREEWAETSPDAIMLLQPTSPFRTPEHIEEALDLFYREKADSLVSVVEVPHNFTPSSLMTLKDGALLHWMDAGPLRRQDKPKLFARNGPAILCLKPSQIMQGDLYSGKTVPFQMDAIHSHDIDNPTDLKIAEAYISQGLISCSES